MELNQATTHITVKIVADSGTMRLTSSDSRLIAGFIEVQRRVSPRLMMEYRRLLDADQVARLGKASLSREGVSLCGKPTPFKEIKFVEIKDGKIQMKRSGLLAVTRTVAVGRIPNFLVFMALYHELSGRTALRGPVETGRQRN